MLDCDKPSSVNVPSQSLLEESDLREGMISTRKVPGTNPLCAGFNISSYIRINLLSGVSARIPYAIERASEPVSLNVCGIEGQAGQHRKARGKDHTQMNMFPECLWLSV